MCPSRLLSAALLVTAGLTTASTADLTKIDRQLKDEPKYTTRTPKYCLLVFGPDAETHVWLVHDGVVMHVLDSPDGKSLKKWRQVKASSNSFTLGDVWEEGGKTVHKNLGYVPASRIVRLSVYVGGKRQVAGWDRNGKMEFTASVKDAPVVHFNGPLTLDLFREQGAVRSGSEVDITAVVGTLGVGPGTFALFFTDSYPKGAWPTAVIEYPAKNGGKPIVAKVTLAEE